MKKIAICPGSFDPMTMGHLDIMRRAAGIFDEVIMLVVRNLGKESFSFTVEERMAFITRCAAGLPNVRVDSYRGLLMDYARQQNAVAIVKGLRAVSDFDYEFQQALTNKRLNPEVETVFMTTSTENMFLSSSVVKQVCQLGGDISSFVPSIIHEDICNRLQGKG